MSSTEISVLPLPAGHSGEGFYQAEPAGLPTGTTGNPPVTHLCQGRQQPANKVNSDERMTACVISLSLG